MLSRRRATFTVTAQYETDNFGKEEITADVHIDYIGKKFSIKNWAGNDFVFEGHEKKIKTQIAYAECVMKALLIAKRELSRRIEITENEL